jgi:hypothetical protein
VILGVLREIAHGHGLLDLGRKLVVELVLEYFNLSEKFLFDSIWHSQSIAANKAAESTKDKTLDSLLYAMGNGESGIRG